MWATTTQCSAGERASATHFSDDVTYATMHALIKVLKEAEVAALAAVETAKVVCKLTEKEKERLTLELTPKPLKLMITTHGGSVYAALGAVDAIRRLKVPVHTVVS